MSNVMKLRRQHRCGGKCFNRLMCN